MLKQTIEINKKVLMKGIIVEFLVTEYVLIDLETKHKIVVKAKGKIKYFDNKDISLVNIIHKIKIGDIVYYETKSNVFLIDSILPRKNELQRPNIANIDQVFLVFSLVKPRFTFKLLDKFLLISQKLKIKVILIFTKLELITQEQLNVFKGKISYYERFYSSYYLDSKKKYGLEPLYSLFKHKVTILAGQTGVGKSTLLNALTSLNLKTQEISLSLNRGKHTTKNSKLYFFYEGYIADTPGFSKLDFSDISADKLKDFYHDFLIFANQCFFGYSCLHIKEKKCKVKEALQQGLISNIRYQNYLILFNEIQKKSKKIRS